MNMESPPQDRAAGPVASQDGGGAADRRQGERRQGPDRRQTPGVSPTGVERRSGHDRRKRDRRSGLERRKGAGIRRSDERRSAEEGEMTDEQFEFIQAITEFRKVNQIAFPTYTDLLAIVKYLGYRKVAVVGAIDIDGFPTAREQARLAGPQAGGPGGAGVEPVPPA